MSQFEGAVIREQGVTFAVVIVRASVIENSIEAGRRDPVLPARLPGHASW